MEKSNKSINQYSTDDVLSFQKLLSLSVYNHGLVPLNINSLDVLPKTTLNLVVPDKTYVENFQLTPLFYTKKQLEAYFPNIKSVDVISAPMFTVIGSQLIEN